MKDLQLKNVIFSQTEIILIKKSGNVKISIDDIERMEYVKPTFINYLLVSGLFAGGIFPGYLKIWLNKKVNNSKSYLIKIKYRDVLKMPEFYLQKIDPRNMWGWKHP